MRDGFSIDEVFASAVEDVLAVGERTAFRGTVDLGVTFKSVEVTQSGFLGVIFGGDQSQSTVELKLATRIHLDNPEVSHRDE